MHYTLLNVSGLIAIKKECNNAIFLVPAHFVRCQFFRVIALSSKLVQLAVVYLSEVPCFHMDPPPHFDYIRRPLFL